MITPFRNWLADLEAQVGQMGVAVADLPLTPQKIYMLECAGFVVDMETGAVVGMETDRVNLSPSGEALAVIVGTGFLD
jgi:hypothetical protein